MQTIARMQRCLLLLFVFTICITACGRRQIIESNELEQEAIGSMVLPLALHEAQFPNARVTNVAQVFAMLDLSRSHRSHPYVFQERFRRFDGHAGFTNSIYEKYVVVPPGITNGRVGGELILMNAVPFRDFNHGLSRMVIVRAGKQDYRPEKVTEPDIQEIFRRSAIDIPKPIPMPALTAPPGYGKLNYPLTTRVRMFFENVAYYYGPGRSFWLPMMLVCLGLPLIIAVVIFVWFSRRSRRG